MGNCKDGKPVKGNVAMVGRMDAVYPAGGPTDGISAVDACCVCGGGKGKSKTQEDKGKNSQITKMANIFRLKLCIFQ